MAHLPLHRLGDLKPEATRRLMAILDDLEYPGDLKRSDVGRIKNELARLLKSA
ncbi:MAG: hypothetical protein HYU51_18330 [Candidatus Rokubacteria bacterium]|nr:hypothetical protein [Candidatus Rokubacteria bacterium]